MSEDSDLAGRSICYLVGAGPGDPGLVTLRARECIEEADVLVYDYLVNPRILDWARPGAELICMGKKSAQQTCSQDDINSLLVSRARKGNVVARLKGGDPMVFGRGGEEAEALRAAGVPFEIVPGITSAIAGPAYAGIPVTHRAYNSQLTVITGHEDRSKGGSSIDFAKLAKTGGTVVMLMGVKRIGGVAEEMMKHGADPELPVALVRWATTGRQETLVGVLSDIAGKVEGEKFEPPAVAVFGEVVALREKLNWFENKPLFGRRIVVTRTRKQAGALTRALQRLGADVCELPMIRIEPPADLRGFAELVQDAHTYDWLIFTSPNGVEAFFEVFFKLYKDAREIGAARIAAVGQGTARKIGEYRLAVDLMPETSVAEGLIEAFEKEIGSVENLRMLWSRAESARNVLARSLSGKGAIVDEAIAYRTVPETEDLSGGMAQFKAEGADVVTFTSSSTVESFLKLGLPLPEDLKIASIGPVTTRTLQANGLYVDIEAKQHDIRGLVRAIRRYYEVAVS